MPTTSTATSADLTLDRNYFVSVSRAMDAAVRAAEYIANARDTGKFSSSYESRLCLDFYQCKREVVLMARSHTDEALLCAVEHLMDCGDVEGVRRTADLWLGHMQPGVRAVITADKEVRGSRGDDPTLIKNRALAASIAIHHGATLYQLATCTGRDTSEINDWISEGN